MKSKLNLIYEESYKGAWHDEVKVVINFGSKMTLLLFLVVLVLKFYDYIDIKIRDMLEIQNT